MSESSLDSTSNYHIVLVNIQEIASTQKTLEQVLGQVLNEELQKEIVDSSEFLPSLIAKLFEITAYELQFGS